MICPDSPAFSSFRRGSAAIHAASRGNKVDCCSSKAVSGASDAISWAIRCSYLIRLAPRLTRSLSVRFSRVTVHNAGECATVLEETTLVCWHTAVVLQPPLPIDPCVWQTFGFTGHIGGIVTLVLLKTYAFADANLLIRLRY